MKTVTSTQICCILQITNMHSAAGIYMQPTDSLGEGLKLQYRLKTIFLGRNTEQANSFVSQTQESEIKAGVK
jgi:hypothetical protein